jgi:hypothetical protein
MDLLWTVLQMCLCSPGALFENKKSIIFTQSALKEEHLAYLLFYVQFWKIRWFGEADSWLLWVCRHCLTWLDLCDRYIKTVWWNSNSAQVRIQYTYGQLVEIWTSVHWNLIGCSMTALPSVLSLSSILPPFSSYCTSIPARKNSEYFSSSPSSISYSLFSPSSPYSPPCPPPPRCCCCCCCLSLEFRSLGLFVGVAFLSSHFLLCFLPIPFQLGSQPCSRPPCHFLTDIPDFCPPFQKWLTILLCLTYILSWR